MSLISRKYFTVINLFILSTGIFFITHIISFNISKELEPPVSTKNIRDIAVTEKEKPISIDAYSIILERNIFNSKRLTEYPSLPAVGNLHPLPLKEERSSIPIRLIGTAAGTPSYAIIEDPFQKDQKIFRVNDTIAPGIKLAEINRNMIVITRDGIREEIELNFEEKNQKMGHPQMQAMGEFASSESAQVSSAPVGRDILRSVGGTQGKDDGKDKNKDKDNSLQLTEGMNRLLTQASLVQHYSGGESEGFIIHSIESGSLYDKIGLKDGDTISEINGLDLKNPESALDIYQTLKNEDYFIIDFTRDENKIKLTSEDSDVLALLIYLYRSGL